MATPPKNAPNRWKKVDGIRYPYRDGATNEEFRLIIDEDDLKNGKRGHRFRCPINLGCKKRIGCKWVEITGSTAELMLPDEKTGDLEIVRFLLSDYSRKKQREFDQDDKIGPFVVYLVAPYGSRTLDAQERARKRKSTGGTVTITGGPKKETQKREQRFKELRTPAKAESQRKRKLG